MQLTRHAAALFALALVVAVLPASGVGATGADAGDPAGQGALSAPAQQDCSFPFSDTDATGTEVTLQQEPRRVVVLQASAAQVLWDIGAAEKVVGMPVKPYTAYLEGSEQRTNVVNQDGTTNVEKVVGLQPDLVIAPNVTDQAEVEQLRDAGLTVYKVPFDKSLSDIRAKITLFGRLTGNCGEAASVSKQMAEQVETIRQAVADESRPRALYYFYNYTAGNGTFIHEVIEAAGGENVAATAGIQGYRPVNPEVVAEQDPEWILVPSDATLPSGEPYDSTTALRQNQTLTVDANLMNQAGPRVVVPMTKLAKAWHPEAYAEANITATTTATASATDQQSPGATDANGAGFTAVAAALAALAGALVARRR